LVDGCCFFILLILLFGFMLFNDFYQYNDNRGQRRQAGNAAAQCGNKNTLIFIIAMLSDIGVLHCIIHQLVGGDHLGLERSQVAFIQVNGAHTPVIAVAVKGDGRRSQQANAFICTGVVVHMVVAKDRA